MAFVSLTTVEAKTGIKNYIYRKLWMLLHVHASKQHILKSSRRSRKIWWHFCGVMNICADIIVVTTRLYLTMTLLAWFGMMTTSKWKHLPRDWSFVRGIHRSPVNSTHKCRWRRALRFSLICVRINSWVNNREAGDLRRHRAHYDIIVMANCTLYSNTSKYKLHAKPQPITTITKL